MDALHGSSPEAAPCSHFSLEVVEPRFFQRLAAKVPAESEQPSNAARKAFFNTSVKKVDASRNEVDFTLSSILKFKQDQDLHTADRKPAEQRRARPGYRNQKRRFLSQRPLERRRRLD